MYILYLYNMCIHGIPSLGTDFIQCTKYSYTCSLLEIRPNSPLFSYFGIALFIFIINLTVVLEILMIKFVLCSQYGLKGHCDGQDNVQLRDLYLFLDMSFNASSHRVKKFFLYFIGTQYSAKVFVVVFQFSNIKFRSHLPTLNQ